MSAHPGWAIQSEEASSDYRRTEPSLSFATQPTRGIVTMGSELPARVSAMKSSTSSPGVALS